jgi:hypothetical protein
MSEKRYKDGRNKREQGYFVSMPHAVLNSPAFLAASPYARMLLLDLAVQYRGNNNGDLSGAWSFMVGRGWRSKETLTRAKRELMRLGLIVETRMGARPNKASLYALTWLALDEAPKLEISAKDYQRGLYRLFDPTKENASLRTPAVPRPP